ncbi:cytochrome aa3 quinol oxidase subunit II [Mangrovibacillus cuniculi]|uniref:Quinol oxidase subunit 2 n=1 Tax=Mangrovibacillus cuniculi TaxID=2593652 RepID=A0A7S8CDA2_9BACI|nr:cytochrome aa3 quinol oxidase subunit II [Mangrovibacillus cuniculi]QPC47787.1 cytochrome aa3 quinol oxidase subunit II [Mangrovibacillus cuniculi]
MRKWWKLFSLSLMMLPLLVLSGCSQLLVLDPKGPMAEIQANLIWLSIGFMLFIVLVVFILFTYMLVKYRDRDGDEDYDPEQHGSTKLEIIWTVVPILIVIALSVPTVRAIYALEEIPENGSDKDPLVVHVTSVDWKWMFSYPEEDIETVNHLVIPADRPVMFRLTSADSMQSFWIPALGGQKYSMAGMETKLMLMANEPGEFWGRNSNFNGEEFTGQEFTVTAMEESEFDAWAEETKETAPELTQEFYDENLMVQGQVEEMIFSGTHLDWVNHAQNASYAVEVRERLGKEPVNYHLREKVKEEE